MNDGKKEQKQKFIYYFQPLIFKDGYWLFEKKEHKLSFFSFQLRDKVKNNTELTEAIDTYLKPICKETHLILSKDIYWASFSRHQLKHSISNWYQIFLFSTDNLQFKKDMSKYVWLKTAEVKDDDRVDWYEKEVIKNALKESIDKGMNPINVTNWLI